MTSVGRDSSKRDLGRGLRWGGRSLASAVLVVLTVIGLLASTAAFWARSVIFEEDRWIRTVEDLPRQDDIAVALSDYLTDQLFVAIDFEQRVEDALPEEVSVIVPLLTNAIRGFVAEETAKFIESDRFQSLWIAANREAHRILIDILEDQSVFPGLERTDDTVTLDLIPALNALLDQLEDIAGDVVGTDLSLPEISDDESTHESIQALSERLGVELPDDFAQITVYHGEHLPQPRDTVVLIDRIRKLIVAATILLGALTIVVSPTRRRTIMALLVAAAVGFVLLLAVPEVIASRVGDLVAEPQDSAAAKHAVRVVFESYMSLYRWMIATAVFSAVMVLLTGQSRLARRTRVELRRVADRFAFTGDVATFLQRYLVWLRIGGPVVGALFVLAFTRRSLTAVFVLFALLTAYESLLTLVPGHPRKHENAEATADRGSRDQA